MAIIPRLMREKKSSVPLQCDTICSQLIKSIIIYATTFQLYQKKKKKINKNSSPRSIDSSIGNGIFLSIQPRPIDN